MYNGILTIAFVLATIAASAWCINVVEAQEIVTDGLISIWTFDRSDIEGKTVKDAFGGNDGTRRSQSKRMKTC